MPPLTPLEILIKARALIADPKNWTNGHYARDKDGNPVDHRSEEATCFCSKGAFNRVLPSDYRHWNVAYNILTQFMDGNVIYYNDSHTHDEVMSAWDHAIKEAANV